MAFDLIISKKAQVEIENAIDYYNEINSNLGIKFFQQIDRTYHILTLNPYFQIKHKEYRVITIEKFPFLLFYHINETNNTIKILSCFQTAKV